MKVTNKSNRKMLLEFLELPEDIRKFDTNKQYSILHEKIEALEKSFFIDDSIIKYSDYVPSKRQDATWQNVLRNILAKDYLNAYFEIIDYIDDNGNRENHNIFEDEMNNIKSILRGINKKIKETGNFENEKKEIKLNGNTHFNFYLADGLMLSDKSKTLVIKNNNIKIYWNGKEIKKKDIQTANNIRSIVSKYENEINKFAEEINRKKYAGRLFHKIVITIGNKNYEIDTMMTKDEDKRNFYNNIKEELYSYIRTLVNNNSEYIQEVEIKTEK